MCALPPGITINTLASTSCTASGATAIATFTRTHGDRGQTIRVDHESEHFIVNFHTGMFHLKPELFYRVEVHIGSTLLGFLDLDVTSKGANRKKTKKETQGTRSH
ncbi:hypothetical protein ACFSC4_29250 [Deinococcus malanensis]|uniref:hypothetical protein n=1 Tax=Deinococcus malanensis TaxID=1706855 RepID=UPI003629426F